MINIQILEENDVILADDWVRPLTPESDGYADGPYVNGRSCYGGALLNHFRWVKFTDRFGECWVGKTLKELNKGMTTCHYILARGDVPKHHTASFKWVDGNKEWMFH